MNETYSPGWKSGDGIFFVIDMCKASVCIDIVRESLIADLRGRFVKLVINRLATGVDVLEEDRIQWF